MRLGQVKLPLQLPQNLIADPVLIPQPDQRLPLRMDGTEHHLSSARRLARQALFRIALSHRL